MNISFCKIASTISKEKITLYATSLMQWKILLYVPLRNKSATEKFSTFQGTVGIFYLSFPQIIMFVFKGSVFLQHFLYERNTILRIFRHQAVASHDNNDGLCLRCSLLLYKFLIFLRWRFSADFV